jgi:hypothetical protein
MIKENLGNIDPLKLSQTAVLFSRIVAALVVLKCYDLAIDQINKQNK